MSHPWLGSQVMIVWRTDKDVEPRNIIAFTFTDQAAAELKDRVLSIVADEIGEIRGLAEI